MQTVYVVIATTTVIDSFRLDVDQKVVSITTSMDKAKEELKKLVRAIYLCKFSELELSDLNTLHTQLYKSEKPCLKEEMLHRCVEHSTEKDITTNPAGTNYKTITPRKKIITGPCSYYFTERITTIQSYRICESIHE